MTAHTDPRAVAPGEDRCRRCRTAGRPGANFCPRCGARTVPLSDAEIEAIAAAYGGRTTAAGVAFAADVRRRDQAYRAQSRRSAVRQPSYPMPPADARRGTFKPSAGDRATVWAGAIAIGGLVMICAFAGRHRTPAPPTSATPGLVMPDFKSWSPPAVEMPPPADPVGVPSPDVYTRTPSGYPAMPTPRAYPNGSPYPNGSSYPSGPSYPNGSRRVDPAEDLRNRMFQRLNDSGQRSGRAGGGISHDSAGRGGNGREGVDSDESGPVIQHR